MLVLWWGVAEAADMYLENLGGLYGAKHAFTLRHGVFLLRERGLNILW